MYDRKIWITGMGVISPLGNNKQVFWDNLINGKCGISTIKGFDTTGLPTKIAGEITDFDPEDFMDQKTAKRSARFTQLALAVAKMAINDAELEINDEKRHNTGIYVGSGSGGFEDLEKALIKEREEGLNKVSILSSIRGCNHAAAYSIACRYGITGPTMTFSSACNSGFNALEVAAEQLMLSKIDRALVIGVEVLSPYIFKGFCLSRGMSTNNEAPYEASRPFDRERDGFVAAEGAGAIILEREIPALKSRKRPLAELCGCASTNDAYSILDCEPTGRQITLAMKRALDQAGVDKEQVDYISAHGPSMPTTDIAETIGIKRLFGHKAHELLISSIKGAIGSPVGATNILQTIASSMAFQEGAAPPTLNYHTPDPECDLNYIPQVARKATLSCIMINSHAYGGGNSSVVLKRPAL